MLVVFFIETAPTVFYPLSLPGALPFSWWIVPSLSGFSSLCGRQDMTLGGGGVGRGGGGHSLGGFVCRRLGEKERGGGGGGGGGVLPLAAARFRRLGGDTKTRGGGWGGGGGLFVLPLTL